MKVIINEKEYEYVSDYPNGWSFIAKDYFKFPVQIGKHKCFIKRFETKRIDNIPGWDMMMKLRWKNEANLPRVYDIATVEENHRQIHYVFQEYLKGSTLEGMVKAHAEIDTGRMAKDVFFGLQSVHKQEYWFADFCEKNIFCTEAGKFYLIDLDSCVPASEPLVNDMPVNMVYWALIFKFYKEVLHLTHLRLEDIPAIKLNYLQLIFLILHLKLYALRDEEDYMSDRAFNELPLCLDQVDPAFRALFRKFAEDGIDADYHDDALEVGTLIETKILPLTKWPPEKIIEEKISREEEPVISPLIKEEKAVKEEKARPVIRPQVPVISGFTSSAAVVNKGESYVISWDVKYAREVQLLKNGEVFYKPGAKTRSIAITEPYDTKVSENRFQLKATNESGEVSSDLLVVRLKDTFKIVEVGSDAKEKTKPARRRTLLIFLLVLVVIAALVVFSNKKPARSPVVISGFNPSSVVEGNPLIISGEHFPKDISKAQVLFDNRPGRIQYISERLITVIVPNVAVIRRAAFGKVTVKLVCDGDTAYATQKLTVLRRRGN